MDVRELIGRRVRLAGHFPGVVVLEDVEPKIDGAVQLRVRLQSGGLEETLTIVETPLGSPTNPFPGGAAEITLRNGGRLEVSRRRLRDLMRALGGE